MNKYFPNSYHKTIDRNITKNIVYILRYTRGGFDVLYFSLYVIFSSLKKKENEENFHVNITQIIF